MPHSSLELVKGETLICTDTGVWLRGGLRNQFGQIYLTNHRLVFLQSNPVLGALFGLLGALFAHWFKKVTFEVALKDVTGVELSSFGFNKRVTLIRTLYGDQKFNLHRPFEEWQSVLKKALKK